MSDVSGSPPILEAGETLGAAIARLRKARKLTGVRLASGTGMSQSKISRIESGKALPTREEAERIARVLRLAEGETRRLVAEAERLSQPEADWQSGPVALDVRQHDTEQQEETAGDFKVFQPTVIIGLLQTSGYARAMLAPLQRLTGESDEAKLEVAVTQAVSARVHRQAILADRRKRFDFVMSEAVLSNKLCPPEEMPAQISQLRKLADQDNISISLIPADADWVIPPYHGFTLLDDRDLFVDLFDTGLIKHDKVDARFYGKVFRSMKHLATADTNAMFDRYFQSYLDLLQRERGHG